MALVLIGEAAVGALAGELLNAVLELKHKVTVFEATLTRLESTLYIISPIIHEIECQICVLGRAEREIQTLAMIREVLEKGDELVCKCLKVGHWNILKKIHYEKRLEELDDSLTRFLSVDIQAPMARDVKEILLAVRRMAQQFSTDYYADVTMGVIESSNMQTNLKVSINCPAFFQ